MIINEIYNIDFIIDKYMMKLIFRNDIEMNNVVKINLFNVNIIFRYNFIYIFMNFIKNFEDKLFCFKDFIIWNINIKFNFDIFDNIIKMILKLLLNLRENEIMNKFHYYLLIIEMIDIKIRIIWYKKFDAKKIFKFINKIYKQILEIIVFFIYYFIINFIYFNYFEFEDLFNNSYIIYIFKLIKFFEIDFFC